MSSPIALQSNVHFTQNEATVTTIAHHLKVCSDSFLPPLAQSVDIDAYALKIREQAITFEAWIEEELVGLIACYFNHPTEAVGFITNVSVLPAGRGKKISQQLLQQTLQYAQAVQRPKVSLEVHQDNARAVHVYEKYGFIREALKDDKWFMTWRATKKLKRSLTNPVKNEK